MLGSGFGYGQLGSGYDYGLGEWHEPLTIDNRLIVYSFDYLIITRLANDQ